MPRPTYDALIHFSFLIVGGHSKYTVNSAYVLLNNVDKYD